MQPAPVGSTSAPLICWLEHQHMFVQKMEKRAVVNSNGQSRGDSGSGFGPHSRCERAQQADGLKPASEVFTHDQAQNGPGFRPQAGLDFEKCAATVLNSHEDVEACFVIEIAE